MTKLLTIITLVLIASGCVQETETATDVSSELSNSDLADLPALPGNVIFLHPDGTGVGHWNFLRLVSVGPDGMTNWDKMERLGLYRPHQANALVTTSHAGATVHAYGIKVHHDSYGLNRDQPITALSGKQMSIMQEAMAAGIRVGVINTGHIGEPGSGAYLASSESRKNYSDIAAQILTSGADVMFSGGEIYTIPQGVIGHHGQEGKRKDGRNLLREAEQAGYTVIFTKEQLLNLPADVDKVIGIFAANHTFNSMTEEKQKHQNLPHYNADQPSYAEMVQVALGILGNDPGSQFFLVAEEEGTDNFSNSANASGTLEALKRADAAIGVAMDFINARDIKDTLLIVTGDSDSGHPAVWGDHVAVPSEPLPLVSETGAQLDGISGSGTLPFVTAPDNKGVTYNFGIAWPYSKDGTGSPVTRTHGYKSELLPLAVDNTDIYRITYDVLFDKTLD